jgi:hypothetical protein
MHLDLSRQTFDPKNHYLRIPLEQGRLLFETDGNEQTAILLHQLQLLSSAFGPHWGPPADTGFRIQLTGDKKSFTIGRGRYIVDGFHCLNDTNELSFLGQPDYPVKSIGSLQPITVVYLDVWERLLTEVNYRDELRDPALEDLPASARTKVVWQVRYLSLPSLSSETELKAGGKASVDALKDLLKVTLQNTATLQARPKHDISETKCRPKPSESYRGLENQLYRVEIHSGSTAEGKEKAFFKWSRDNGAITFPIKSWKEPTGDLTQKDFPVEVELKSIGRDARTRLQEGDWVEYIDEITTLLPHLDNPWMPRIKCLFYVKKIDFADERKITLIAPTAADAKLPEIPDKKPRRGFLRKWDSELIEVPTDVDPEENWKELDEGIEIRFAGKEFRPGDYWLIPARYATAGILWDSEEANPNTPKIVDASKIEHHYAPLAILRPSGENEIVDCRREINLTSVTKTPT